MAKSYKSALPTWTTYTPYVSPVVTQAPINQENWWRNRAHHYQPLGTAGHFNRIAMDAASMAKGTGAAHVVGGILGHQPISRELEKMGSRGGRNPQAQWYRKMQESLQQGTPETMVGPGEAAPQTPTQVRAARTAAATVNPADVKTQEAARQTAELLGAQAVSSPNAGTTKLPRTKIPIINQTR